MNIMNLALPKFERNKTIFRFGGENVGMNDLKGLNT
jgi:hypothetical protein